MDNANLYLAYARHFPAADAEFLCTGEGRRFSYSDLENHTARLAGYLLERGLRLGDRVTVQCEKCPEIIWLYLACLRAGLVFHPLNPAYTTAECEYFVEDAAPAALIGDATSEASLTALAERYRIPLVMTLEDLCREGAGAPVNFATIECPPDAVAALLPKF